MSHWTPPPVPKFLINVLLIASPTLRPQTKVVESCPPPLLPLNAQYTRTKNVPRLGPENWVQIIANFDGTHIVTNYRNPAPIHFDQYNWETVFGKEKARAINVD